VSLDHVQCDGQTIKMPAPDLGNWPLTWYFSVGVAGFEPTTSSSRTLRGPKVGRPWCWSGCVVVCGWVRWCAVVLLYFPAVWRWLFGVLGGSGVSAREWRGRVRALRWRAEGLGYEAVTPTDGSCLRLCPYDRRLSFLRDGFG
jgi:hypothetical protein